MKTNIWHLYQVAWITWMLAMLAGFCVTASQQCAAQTATDQATIAQESEGNPSTLVRGVVFHDVNADRKLDDGDIRLNGVAVSNGGHVVRTDQQGRYEVPIDNDSIIFVTKPKGYRTLVDDQQLPRFYYIHKPQGSPQLRFPGVAPTGALPASINFPLYAQTEPEQFQVILFGDPQSRNKTEIGYMNRDVIQELIGSSAAFGVTLGDIMFDDLSLFDYHNGCVALIGIPWYNVLGNHDLNFDSKTRQFCNETFEKTYGPTYYSFDYGNVHFVVLDNINWRLPAGETEPRYDGTFGDRQVNWLLNDLNHIPENQPLVLFMHIPINECSDAESVYRLIEPRPICFSVSAHRHFHEHRFIGADQGWRGDKPHHHLVNVTVSGSWWSGQKDERGIPHTMMADGGPNGYSVLTLDGDDYRLDVKAAARSADYQLRVMAPDEVTVDQLPHTELYVNVFNGSEKSTVSMRVAADQPWTTLARVSEIDPHFRQLFDREQQIVPPPEPKLTRPKSSSHLWKAPLPSDLVPGIYLIEVQTIDMHGRQFSGRHVLNVVR